jgi:hypothetical protein
LAFEVFGDMGQCLLVCPLMRLGGFILQAQCPQPVGNEVLNFQAVGRGGFQLARLHQRLLVAELAGLQLVEQHIQGFVGNPPDKPKSREVEFSEKEVLHEEIQIQ